MRDFRILPEVADDVAAAADWYDKEGHVGLGDRFLTTFYAACALSPGKRGDMLIPFTPVHRAFSMEVSGQRRPTGVNGISIFSDSSAECYLTASRNCGILTASKSDAVAVLTRFIGDSR